MDSLTEPFASALQAALEDYGAGFVLLILAVIYLYVDQRRDWKNILAAKDREIKLMAAEKRELERLIIQHRLSTQLPEPLDSPAPDVRSPYFQFPVPLVGITIAATKTQPKEDRS